MTDNPKVDLSPEGHTKDEQIGMAVSLIQDLKAERDALRSHLRNCGILDEAVKKIENDLKRYSPKDGELTYKNGFRAGEFSGLRKALVYLGITTQDITEPEREQSALGVKEETK